MGLIDNDFDEWEIKHPKRFLAFICVGIIGEILFLANYF
jgi:hypothetical protein